MKNYKFTPVIPLIGGLSIAGEKYFGEKPKKVISFDGFYGNDKYYLRWLKENGVETDYITNTNEIDFTSEVALGLPPCAGLSNASTKICDLEHTSKINKYMIDFIDLSITKLKSNLIIFENAPGLYTNKGKDVRMLINALAAEKGYSVTYILTNTNLHGLPQNRKRTYAILVKGNKALDIDFIKQKRKSFYDVLKNIKGKYTIYSDRLEYDEVEYFSLLPAFRKVIGGNPEEKLKSVTMVGHLQKEKELVDEFIKYYEDTYGQYNESKTDTVLRNLRNIKIKGIRYKGFGIAKNEEIKTIFSASPHYYRSDKDRLLKYIEEYAALMGMPKNFNYEKVNLKLLGQNTPVNTSYDIVKEFYEAYENKNYFDDNILFINNIKKEKFDKNMKKIQ